jgi:hypothetical protein
VLAVPPVTPGNVTDMLGLPADTPVASPLALIVAIAVFEDAQVTWLLPTIAQSPKAVSPSVHVGIGVGLFTYLFSTPSVS